MRRRKRITTGNMIGALLFESIRLTVLLTAWAVVGILRIMWGAACYVGGAFAQARRPRIAEAPETQEPEEEAEAPPLLPPAQEAAQKAETPEEAEAEEPEEEPEELEEEAHSPGAEAEEILHGRSLEKALKDEQRRLLALLARLDRVTYTSSRTPEEWERYQKTKAYRGLMWDIRQSEDLIISLEAYLGIVDGWTVDIMAARDREAEAEADEE